MKTLKSLGILTLFISMSLFTISCGHSHSKDGSHSHETHTEAADETGKEYTSAYICPMHCEGSGGAEPGKCPACGMDYVKNDEHEQYGDDEHEGHDHDGHKH